MHRERKCTWERPPSPQKTEYETVREGEGKERIVATTVDVVVVFVVVVTAAATAATAVATLFYFHFVFRRPTMLRSIPSPYALR